MKIYLLILAVSFVSSVQALACTSDEAVSFIRKELLDIARCEVRGVEGTFKDWTGNLCYKVRFECPNEGYVRSRRVYIEPDTKKCSMGW